MKIKLKSIRNLGIGLFTACIFSFSSYAQENSSMDLEESVVMDTDSSELVWGPCPEFMPNGCEVAVLHGDPAKPNVDILFRVPSNSDIPEHYHNSVERMILLAGELDVTYEGEKTQTLKQGSYAYGPAKKPHSAKCGNAGPCVLFIAFEKPIDAIPINK